MLAYGRFPGDDNIEPVQVAMCFVYIVAFVWMMIVWVNLSNLNDKMRDLILLKKISMGIEPDRIITAKSLVELAAKKAGMAVGTVASKLSKSKTESPLASPSALDDGPRFNPELIFCTKCGGANARGHTHCLSCGNDLV